MNNKYTPEPLNLDDVVLPEELTSLIEVIARNVHEVWASNRIEQGWSYGTERSDHLKQHPCLVSYDDLSEQERDYDRATALGTLKVIYKLGFKVVKE